MKKVAFLFTVAVLSLTSCKKDYACECNTKISQSGTTLSDNTISETIDRKMSKKNATSSCANTKSIVEKQVKGSLQQGLDASVSCTLK